MDVATKVVQGKSRHANFIEFILTANTEELSDIDDQLYRYTV